MVREYDKKVPPKNQVFLADLEVDLAPEVLRAYDAVVHPSAILPIPRYFIQEWLPLLGSSRAWLTLSFRQVAFVSRYSKDEITIHTTLRKLGHWCGLTHVRIHQILKDQGYLNWFVRNPQGELADQPTPRSQPTTFMVRSDIPLTPQDQIRLSYWFEQRTPSDDKEWVQVLSEAMEAKKLVPPKDIPLPQFPMTIQQIVYSQRGDETPLPPGIDEACNELYARWVQPDSVSLVTHYFLIRWLPYLSPSLGWLIVLLRSLTYQQKNEFIGQVWINGGWSSIADSLGVSRRSMTRWISAEICQLFFQKYPNAQDPTDRRNLLIAIRLSEPIHPMDQEIYQTRLAGQSLTSPISDDSQFLTNTVIEDSHSLTSCGETSTELGISLPTSGRNFTEVGHNLTGIEPIFNNHGTKLNSLNNSLITYFNKLNQVNIQQLNHQIGLPNKDVVVEFDQWQLNTIITRTGVGEKVRSYILDASDQEKTAFMGWMLFALSVPSIHYPVLFAYKRIKEGLPPDPFLQLALTSPSKCLNWLVGNDEDVPFQLQKAIEDLRRQRGHEKLIQLGAVSSSVDEKIGKKAEEREVTLMNSEKIGTYTPPIVIRPDGMTAEQAWIVARGKLQEEVNRVTFETWLRDVEYIGFEEGTITLGVANEYARKWLEDRLTRIAERVLTGIVGENVKVQFSMIYEEV